MKKNCSGKQQLISSLFVKSTKLDAQNKSNCDYDSDVDFVEGRQEAQSKSNCDYDCDSDVDFVEGTPQTKKNTICMQKKRILSSYDIREVKKCKTSSDTNLTQETKKKYTPATRMQKKYIPCVTPTKTKMKSPNSVKAKSPARLSNKHKNLLANKQFNVKVFENFVKITHPREQEGVVLKDADKLETDAILIDDEDVSHRKSVLKETDSQSQKDKQANRAYRIETPNKKAIKLKQQSKTNIVCDCDSEEDFVEVTPEKTKYANCKQENKIHSACGSWDVKKCETSPNVNLTQENIFETPKKKYKPPTRTPRKPTPRLTPTKFKTQSPNSNKSPNKYKNLSDVKEFNVKLLENFVGFTPPEERDKVLIKDEAKLNKSIILMGDDDTDEEEYALKENNSQNENVTEHEIETSRKKGIKLNFEFKNSRDPLKDVTELAQSNNVDLNNKEVIESKNNDHEYEDMLNDSWDFMVEEEYLLDLSTNNYCKILGIDNTNNGISLKLESVEDKEKAKCLLKDFWMSSILRIGCKVYVEAKLIENNWIISKEYGVIVFEPDYLISCTSITKSLFCKRQAIFQQYYSYDGGNKYMILGILVHQLFQKVLKAKIKTSKGVESIAKRLLNSKDTIQMFYNCIEEIDFIKKQIDEYVPKIVQFMVNYFGVSSKRKVQKDNWNGTIDSIEDIEENIWCKELGLKGKIDVTVKSKNQLVPLELKTGKSTMSLEHRTQMLLYVLMMNKIGYNAKSSLLLYLKDGIVKDFVYTPNHTKDVLLIRNELAYYLSMKVNNFDDEDDSSMRIRNMPEPLSEDRLCSRCDYNIICTSYSKYEDYNVSDAYKTMSDKVLSHLETSHIDYFIRWTSLIRIEASECVNFKDYKEIYTVPPYKREQTLQCISHLKLLTVIEEENDRYKHTFVKEPTSNVFMKSLINDGSYVVVSTDKRPSIASGIVSRKETNSISITLDRNIKSKYCNVNDAEEVLYHLDTYDTRNGDVFNYSNLALLLEPNDKACKLRKLIIDKARPTFQDDLPKSIVNKCINILKRLNKNQKRAVLKSLMANDYLLIKGMPGTGKTATIVSLIQCLIKLNKSVLITSHTHSSVDNVCLKLIDEGVKLLRLGTQNRVHEDLHNYTESVLTSDCSSVEELEKVYNTAQIVAVTCLGAKHIALTKRTFDYCIIDECTQILQPSIIRGLLYANVFILIGDPDQLEPVVRNSDAMRLGLGESLFERLSTEHSCVTLTENYRMNKTVTACANALTYKGKLTVGNKEVELLTLQLNNDCPELVGIYEREPWIKFALDDKLESSVRVIDTGPVWNRMNLDDDDRTSCTNDFENFACKSLVDALIKGGLSDTNIGVISPYKAQVAKLSSTLRSYRVAVSTVDQFQGRDKEVIIYSCTRSRDPTKTTNNLKYEILGNKKRLTVALTRAKVKFILIADLTTIISYTPFAELLNGIDDIHNVIKLYDPSSGFNWKKS